jgi:hydroxypyruvate reductase/glycerate 2-kinase
VALVHAAVAREVAQHGRLAAPPAVILSGGETTVTLRGAGGSGGRNQEFLLALASALLGTPCIHALACDTDGIDGFSKAAGAVIDPTTPERAASAGINLKESLERQDSGGFFSALGDTVVTGPTRTNVNDFRAILVTAKP